MNRNYENVVPTNTINDYDMRIQVWIDFAAIYYSSYYTYDEDSSNTNLEAGLWVNGAVAALDHIFYEKVYAEGEWDF